MVSSYTKIFKDISDQIESLRLEIYQGKYIKIDDSGDKKELDDLLFRIQSELRFNVNEIIKWYEGTNERV